MARGDHIRVRRRGYWHHGIDCGDGTVVHYAGSPWDRGNARIVRTSYDRFLRGGLAEIVSRAAFHESEYVVTRALSRVGEGAYSVLRNNCEHFAHWCMSGRARSHQVRRGALKVAGTVAVVGACVALSIVLKRPVLPKLIV